MQIELSLEEIDYLQKVINGVDTPPINYAVFKKLGAAYERGLTPVAADLPTRCPDCDELAVYGSYCHNALCPSAIR